MKHIPAIFIAVIITVFSGFAQSEAEDYEPLYGSGSEFGRVVLVQGQVYISRDTIERDVVEQNFAVNSLDLIETDEDSRVVIQFTDGTILKVGEKAKLDFPQLGSENEDSFALLMRLWSGKLYLDIDSNDMVKEREFRVDTEDASIFFLSEGKYRVDKNSYETSLKTTSGMAEVAVEDGSKLVNAGQSAHIGVHERYISVRTFNTLRMDDFDLWAANTYKRRDSISAEYVPSEIRHYVYEMDTYGNWYYESDVDTYVWRPFSVAVDWTPYTYGRWAWSPYGSSWVSYYPWGYTPFHYGSWHFSVSFGWVWVPGRYYSPAHVVWNYWGDHIGWYPYYYSHRHGRRVASHLRGHALCISAGNLYGRRINVRRVSVPSNRTVYRTARPIAPRPDQLRSDPVKVVSRSVRTPVTRNTIKSETTRIRTVTRIDSNVKPGMKPGVRTTSSSTSSSGHVVRSGSHSAERRSIKTTGSRSSSPNVIQREVSKPSVKRGRTISSGNSSTIIKRNSSSSGTSGTSIKRSNSSSGSSGRTIKSNSSSSSSGRTIKRSNSSNSVKKPVAGRSYTPSYSGNSVKKPYVSSGSSSRSVVSPSVKRGSSSSSYSSRSSSTPRVKSPSSRSYSVSKPSSTSRSSRSYSKPASSSRSVTRSTSSSSSSSSRTTTRKKK